MKTQTKPKSKFRGFYTALALSLVMIGAACVFAYRQTSQTLEQNLNSLSEQMEVTTTATLPYEAPVVGVQTDVARRQRQQSLQRLLQKRPLPRRPHRKRLHRRQNRKKHPCTS